LMFIAIRYQHYLGIQARSSHLTDVTLLDTMSVIAVSLHAGCDLGDKSTMWLI